MTPDQSRLKQAALTLLKENHRVKGQYHYTVPSPSTYPYQWLWDSCFHAIALTHFDLTAAKNELRSLAARQFENGLMPHMIYWQPSVNPVQNFLKIAWGKQGTSSITQPPMLAYAAWQIFQADGETAFLDEIYPRLFHYYKYLLNERDPHEKHLVGIINPDESGEDNSPRFDRVLDLPPAHSLMENYRRRLALVEENKKCHFDAPFCMKNFFWVKDTPFNAILVENLRCLGRIAQKLNREYDAEYFEQEADRVAQAMRALMLEDGLYWSTFGENYQKIKVKTWAVFSPLFAKIPTQAEAETLIKEHLLNEKEFWPAYPVPSVALDEPSFNPTGFWRGPTWLAVNWFIYHGLLNYGLTAAANKLRDASVALLAKAGFREQFHPLTGAGQGAHQFTWGALVVDMVDKT